MALDIIDILLARAGNGSGGSGGGDTSDAVTSVTIENADTSAAKIKQAKVRKNNITRAYDIMKNYTSKGQNEDGSMTQKAITSEFSAAGSRIDTLTRNLDLSNGRLDAAFNAINAHDAWGYRLEERIDGHDTAINSADTQIANINSQMATVDNQIDMLNARIDDIVVGDVNLGPENAGKIVLVGDDGGLVPGTLTEEDIKGGVVPPPPPPVEPAKILGLEIDYENLTCARLADAVGLSAGANFDEFSMYGGRKRCNVSDDGEITAFYGDPSYVEDGSNGQVMLYQPKFYYKHVIVDRAESRINKEELYLCEEEEEGFEIHPLFVYEDGREMEYALLPVYEGSIYDNGGYILDDGAISNFSTAKLSSIAGAKPLSGANNEIYSYDIKQFASNRGAGWCGSDMRAESALQMLMMIEYASLNIQKAMGESGPTNLSVSGSDNNYLNCGLITGSTGSLGNGTGRAPSSVQTVRDVATTYTAQGKCSISYRGMENPWGNMWRIVCDIEIDESGNPWLLNGDAPASIGFSMPSASGTVEAMGYSNDATNWLYMPGGVDGTNVLIDDYYWKYDTNVSSSVLVGGRWNLTHWAGIFAYDLSKPSGDPIIFYANPRIMYVPIVSNFYDANIEKWKGV